MLDHCCHEQSEQEKTPKHCENDKYDHSRVRPRVGIRRRSPVTARAACRPVVLIGWPFLARLCQLAPSSSALGSPAGRQSSGSSASRCVQSMHSRSVFNWRRTADQSVISSWESGVTIALPPFLKRLRSAFQQCHDFVFAGVHVPFAGNASTNAIRLQDENLFRISQHRDIRVVRDEDQLPVLFHPADALHDGLEDEPIVEC